MVNRNTKYYTRTVQTKSIAIYDRSHDGKYILSTKEEQNSQGILQRSG